MPDPTDSATFWHVSITVTGEPMPVEEVRTGLQRLSEVHPFLLEAGYAADRAEVTYWDEGPDARTVAHLAADLWQSHRVSAGLPDWRVVAVEVVDQGTVHARRRSRWAPRWRLGIPGRVRPI